MVYFIDRCESKNIHVRRVTAVETLLIEIFQKGRQLFPPDPSILFRSSHSSGLPAEKDSKSLTESGIKFRKKID